MTKTDRPIKCRTIHPTASDDIVRPIRLELGELEGVVAYIDMPPGMAESVAQGLLEYARELDAAKRVAELESMLNINSHILETITKAAGFKPGEQYSAAGVIAALQGQGYEQRREEEE